MNPTAYRVNSPNVAGDVIDGEAVIVNLEKGTYYSLEESGAAIWRSIETGRTREGIIANCLALYRGDPDLVSTAVGSLLEELEKEELIRPVDEEPEVEVDAPPPPETQDVRPLFVVPEIRKYTDMEELLQLDPIHDVDDMGWPVPKPVDNS